MRWTGNLGTGTSGYRQYGRDHEFNKDGKPSIPGSSDPGFRGNSARWNPEELLVASLSSCHQLWYLHLCSEAGVIVTDYVDQAEGVMEEEMTGAGQFVSVMLRPRVTITAASDAAKARSLHEAAHKMCFVARSVNFPVSHAPEIICEA